MTALAIILACLLVLLVGVRIWTLRLRSKAEASVPLVGEVVTVPGGAIHYVDIGPREAPPVLLIHGLSAQLQHFTYAMTDRLDGFRLIVIDRPGCGYSERESEADATLAGQARMIGALLDRIGVGPVVVAGHSLGGAVALALALDRPETVKALALLAPLTHMPEEVPPLFRGLEIRTEWLRRALSETIAGPIAWLTRRTVLEVAFAPEPVVPDMLTRGGAMLGIRPKGFRSASGDLVALERGLPEQIARYGALKVPGGVLYGSEDALLSPKEHGAPMDALGLAHETISGRGHMLPLTAPEACADFIRRMASKAG